ncbi:PAS domain S-box-containing protein [Palleronia aestuarii]|uniref:histidine kinase n=1 Tax=Palleronia aestuarii TaxID=568105 RepID=A0A2W7QCR8_9RHOB|nr:PAS domain-containing protein [Palleronia aestuarii]PZX19629.1 PAS domain S-box-containing protein [Palleronia aestuarii]
MNASNDDGGRDQAGAIRSFRKSNISIVLTDPRRDDNPIVFANEAFLELTGYAKSSVLGRNCRFLQGDLDNEEERKRIRAALAAEEELTIELQNVRADGTRFLNRLMIAPIIHEGECIQFLGVQTPVDMDEGQIVADRQLKELQHRVKNHLSMIIGLIRQQTRTSGNPHEFSSLARRIESLQLLYEELTNGVDDGTVPMGSYLSRIASTIGHIDGRAGIRLQVEVESISMPVTKATSIGLILSELLTNAFQHAFEGRSSGLIDVKAMRLSNDAFRMTVSDDGVGLPGGTDWPSNESLGGRLLQAFVTSLEASLDIQRVGTGTIVILDVPASPDDQGIHVSP